MIKLGVKIWFWDQAFMGYIVYLLRHKSFMYMYACLIMHGLSHSILDHQSYTHKSCSPWWLCDWLFLHTNWHFSSLFVL